MLGFGRTDAESARHSFSEAVEMTAAERGAGRSNAGRS
jgi:hypothetical protein